ncbi:recombinase family protein [Micromonospora pallida]|uniref:recombinase family protein n=1 Tax=Micromonospora pallida TaxID=145854 RepID=UPI000AFA4583
MPCSTSGQCPTHWPLLFAQQNDRHTANSRRTSTNGSPPIRYGTGYGLFAIAEGLTANHVPCPSAHDRARNPHRSGIAWSKSAIRVILTNPRYTGRQVWNKQRTDEVLLDVDDVALGHTGVMRWNKRDKWITSKEIVHPPLIDDTTFEQAQTLLGQRARRESGNQRLRRARNPYMFRGLV